VIRLFTFGRLALESARKLGPSSRQSRPLALMALIASAGSRGITRDHVLVYFWPEHSPQAGRNVLNQTLHALRRDLRRKDLFLPGRVLSLNRDRVTSDLWELEDSLAMRDLGAARDLYRGRFLEGFSLPGAPEFERWADSERDRLAQRYFQALATLASRASDKGDHLAAATYWRELLVQDPLNSIAAAGLITSLTAAGDRPSALAFARQYRALLRAELDVSAEPAVTKLIAGLEAWSGQTAPLAVPLPAGEAGNELSALQRFAQPLGPVPPARSAASAPARARQKAPAKVPSAKAASPTLSDEVYRRIVESSADLIYRCSLTGVFTYVNSAVEKLAGVPRAAIIGRSYLDFVREDFRAGLIELYTRQIREQTAMTYTEFPAISGDGTEVWLEQHVELTASPDGGMEILAVARDVTLRKRLEQAREAVSIRDEATDLLNSTGFQAILEHRISSSRRSGRSFHLFFLRIEASGDDSAAAMERRRNASLAIAELLRSTFRDSDVLARLSADEFGVLAVESDPKSGARLSQRLQSSLAKMADLERPAVRISVAYFDPALAGTIEEVMDPRARGFI
jgi:PAS domain S-box-containing protein